MSYDPPESGIEVLVSQPEWQEPSAHDPQGHIRYLVTFHTDLPFFPARVSRVRRRYRDFEQLWRLVGEAHPQIQITEMPAKQWFGDPRDPAMLKERCAQFTAMLQQ